MTKEQKCLRNVKLDEFANEMWELEKLSRDEILNGSKSEINCGGNKKVVVYDNLHKITRKQIACVKDALSYLFENCNMNRRDVLNRIRYVENKAFDNSNYQYYMKFSNLYSSVKVFGK